MRKILLPYDFSPQAKRALGLVLSGVPFGPEVSVEALHVLDDAFYEASEHSPPEPETMQAQFKYDLQRATTKARVLADDPSITVISGNPLREILARVGSYGGIILGGQGHGGLGETFLGTTAMRVVRDAAVSVYVVKKGVLAGTPARVLCAIDYDEVSRHALKEAHTFCRICVAKLSLIHVVPIPFSGFDYPGLVVPLPTVQNAKGANDELIAFERKVLGKTYASNYEVTFASGGTVGDIVNEAAVERADAIVVGAHRNGLGKRFLGSVSEGIIHRAACDVYVVR